MTYIFLSTVQLLKKLLGYTRKQVLVNSITCKPYNSLSIRVLGKNSSKILTNYEITSISMILQSTYNDPLFHTKPKVDQVFSSTSITLTDDLGNCIELIDLMLSFTPTVTARYNRADIVSVI